MTDHASKSIAIKFIGAKRPTETIQIVPGTTVADVLSALNLSGGYQLSDAKNADALFRPTDDIYARVEDGELLYASSFIEAGA